MTAIAPITACPPALWVPHERIASRICHRIANCQFRVAMGKDVEFQLKQTSTMPNEPKYQILAC